MTGTNVFRSLKFNLNSQVKTLSVLVISKQISQIHIFHIWKMCQTKLLTLRFQKSIASQIQHGILGHFRWHTKKTLTILLDIRCSKLQKKILVQLRNLILETSLQFKWFILDNSLTLKRNFVLMIHNFYVSSLSKGQ